MLCSGPQGGQRGRPGMEGGSPGATPRPPAPAEGPEAGGPHAVLEGKVKALKEKRGAGRPGGPAPAPERPSPRKPRPRRAKPGTDAAAAAAEPRAQLRTYLTDGLLDGGAGAGTDAPGGPWRMPGAGGGTGGLSLAQRVERNRRLLQEVLGPAPGRAAAGPPRDVPAHEPLASDADWDSGVSLPDAEGCRALAAGPELTLSPRHEQAKQLLQRARMKARTNPLRASHDILPAGPPGRREPSGTPAPEAKQRAGAAPASGSLSDSSSGESSWGPRRARGPSPSRVRFEDESARDAEARYRERLQLRQRRALGSLLCSLGRGPLLSEPDQGPAAGGDAGGKCTACGSYLGAPAAGRSGDPRTAGNGAGGREEADAPPPEPKARTLGPRGSPLWILPSRQRIRTEKIRETYIGDATSLDDADSALESTDTSDGCRTDSEEGGPRGGRGHPRPRWHSASAATPGREPPEQERRGADASGRRDSGSREPRGPKGSAGTEPLADGLEAFSPCAVPPGKAGGREAGDEGAGPRRAPSSQPAAHVPAPPAASKGCSPVPCGKAAGTGSPRAPSRASGCPEPAAPVALGPAERPGPCSSQRPPGSPLRASATSSCSSMRGRGPSGAAGVPAGSGDAAGPSAPGGPSAAGTDPIAVAAAVSPQPDAAGVPVRPAPAEAVVHPVEEKRGPKGSAARSGSPEPAAGRKGGSPSAAGLRKLLCSLGRSTKQRLGRFRCYSMEQLPAAPGPAAPGPLCPPRRAASVQNLHALLGKAPRASAYLVAEPGRRGGPAPRRSLSAEDIGAPDLLRTVGRVLEVFPDGTSQLELRRPPDGAFGFRVASGHGRPDTGVYVQEMADAGTAKLYAGLLGVGDEILQVDGAAVSGLGLARIRELLLRADTLRLRVLRQRPARR
ncbi:uncharacterized protein KIAA1614 homolog isoform X2 [Apteryx mantelli]|uniref:Uncharacterized protein KIAA1614 homolog isoform X2 n=1 Tax=Apteryx mantelli TaxID=2696672 RepID=A0ABM4EUZ1_9AVES